MKLMTPDSLSVLDDCLIQASEDTRMISGGTDMLINLQKNGFTTVSLIDLSGVRELKYISAEGAEVCIGALATLRMISDSKVLSEIAPALCSAADKVGSTQIRNAATIGGNVANAFAGADLIPPLLALDAMVDTLGKGRIKRSIPIGDFVIGNRKNALQTGEIVTQIRFKRPESIQYFGKIGSRSRVTISKLNMAASITCDKGIIDTARIAFGALGATAFLSEAVSQFLQGKAPDEVDVKALADVMRSVVDEAIPTRSSRHYKRDAVRALANGLCCAMAEKCEVQYEATV